MGLETSETIAGLVATNPLGTDPKSEGDDHLRLIKDVLQKDALSFDAGRAQHSLVNTGFEFWQRGTTIAGLANTITWMGDRWGVRRSTDALYTLSRQGTAGNRVAHLQRTAADASTQAIRIGQVLETIDSVAFAGTTATFSFVATAGPDYSNAGNALRSIIATGTGVDQTLNSFFDSGWTGYNPSFTDNIISTTPTRFFHEFAIADNVTQIGVKWEYFPTGVAGAADFVEISEVMFHPGKPALPFAMPNYAAELARCQRYYEKSFNEAIDPAQNTGSNGGQSVIPAYNAGASAQRGWIPYKVPKRISPTITTYNPQAANAEVRDATVGADCSSTTAINNNEYGLEIACTGNAGTSVANRLTIHWTASAEM